MGSQTVQITTKPVEQFPKYSDVLEYANIREGDAKRLQTESEEVNLKDKEKQQETTQMDESNYAEQMLRLVNEERKKAGVAPLELDSTLTKAAQIRAKEITQAWGHTRPNGKDFRTVVYEVDNSYETKSISENISSWYSPETAVNGWMNSTKGHKENMLNTKWKYAGVGHEGSHWVIMFSD